MDRRKFLALCAAAAAVPQARAQSGPLTKLVFPFAAGGSGDMLCRLLAEQLRGALDRTIIVENRTGADGLIGIKSVMMPRPTATILITTGPTMYLLPMVEAKPSRSCHASCRSRCSAASSSRSLRGPRPREGFASCPPG